MKSYEGASGKISFDENGDGIRNYVVKTVSSGKVIKIEQ